MQNLRLHFTNRPAPDRPLTTGVHRIVREAAGTIGVGDALQGALLAQICVDRRGLWLQVANGMRGVHINGRPVKRMAVLRPGDAVYVEGVELLLQSGFRSAAEVLDSDAGQGDIEHLSNLTLWKHCSGGDEYNGAACRPTFEQLARRHVWQTPTLAFWAEVATIGTPASEQTISRPAAPLRSRPPNSGTRARAVASPSARRCSSSGRS